MADSTEEARANTSTPVEAEKQQTEVAKEQRIATFGKFFKNYMSVSAVVTAALPIPVDGDRLNTNIFRDDFAPLNLHVSVLLSLTGVHILFTASVGKGHVCRGGRA